MILNQEQGTPIRGRDGNLSRLGRVKKKRKGADHIEENVQFE